MNTLLNHILTSSPNRSNKEIIRWWEQRRIFYNAVMLVAGSITILLALLFKEIIFSDLINVLPPILIVAFSANLFYTLGWVVEIACYKFIPDKKTFKKAGPVLFIAGIFLSVFFTVAIDIAIMISFLFQ